MSRTKIEEGLQYWKLKGYVAAISASHKEYTKGPKGQVKVVQDFQKGTFIVHSPGKGIQLLFNRQVNKGHLAL